MIKKLFTGKWLTRRHIDYGNYDEKYYEKNPSVVYEKDFVLPEVKRMKVRICALGYYLIKINDRLITDDVLNNEWTYYSKRKYYDEYDISEFLTIGKNTIKVELGNGMYNPAPLHFFGEHNFREHLDIGEPKFVLNVICDDKVIVKSDDTWKAYTGDLRFNNVYLGEVIDPAFSGQKISYKCPEITNEDQETFMRSFIPKCKKFTPISMKRVETLKDGSLLVDFGQLTSGFINLSLDMTKASKIKLTYCESTDDEGNLDFSTSYAGGIGCVEGMTGGPGAPEKALEIDEIYAPKGKSNFENKFTFHSFRYVVITGMDKKDIVSMSAIPVHTDLKQTGKVKTNNNFLNELFEAGIQTRLNNIHSVYEDCARERLQYGGDIVALSTSMLYSLDLSQFNRKVIDDFIFSQTPKGGIPETAPYIGIQTQGTDDKEGPLLWQLVLPYMVYKNYQFYGDVKLVKHAYKYIEKQYQYFKSWKLEDLAQHCIGDHGSPTITGVFYSTPDKLFVGYCTILIFNEVNIRLAKILGKDVTSLEADNKAIRDEIIKVFENKDGSFGDKTESSYAFALALNLGNRDILKKHVIDEIKTNDNVWSSGIFGHSLLYTELHKLDCDDVVYNWITNETKLGFKWMLKNGNKILREQFVHHPNSDSANHAMFSSYLKWYYEAIGGIRISDDTKGFSKIIINPYFNKEIGDTNISINTVHGLITTKTTFKNGEPQYQVSIPKEIEYQINGQASNMHLDKTEKDNEIVLCFSANTGVK